MLLQSALYTAHCLKVCARYRPNYGAVRQYGSLEDGGSSTARLDKMNNTLKHASRFSYFASYWAAVLCIIVSFY